MKRSLMVMLVVVVVALSASELARAEVKAFGLAQAQIVVDESRLDNEAYFTLKRCRLFVKGTLDENEKISVFAHLGALKAASPLIDFVMAYDLGGLGKLGIGRFCLPFGLQNLTNPYNLNTINFALPTMYIIGTKHHDIGIRLIGKKEETMGLNWKLAVVNGDETEVFLTDSDDSDKYKDAVGRIGIVPVEGLALGVSGFYSKDVLLPETDLLGVDLKYATDVVYLQCEYMAKKIGDDHAQGMYVEAGYKIGKLEPVARYDVYDDELGWSDTELTVAAFGLNYYASDTAKVQMIGELKDEPADTDNNTFIIQTSVKF